MTALDLFRDRIDEIERGPHDADACRQLIRDICAHPWETVDERNAAQRLVNRLNRLMRGAGPP